MHRTRPLDPERFFAVALGVLFTVGGLTVALGLLRFTIPIWLTYLGLTWVTLYAKCDYHQRQRMDWAIVDILDRCWKHLLLLFVLLAAITRAMNP